MPSLQKEEAWGRHLPRRFGLLFLIIILGSPSLLGQRGAEPPRRLTPSADPPPSVSIKGPVVAAGPIQAPGILHIPLPGNSEPVVGPAPSTGVEKGAVAVPQRWNLRSRSGRATNPSLQPFDSK